MLVVCRRNCSIILTVRVSQWLILLSWKIGVSPLMPYFKNLLYLMSVVRRKETKGESRGHAYCSITVFICSDRRTSSLCIKSLVFDRRCRLVVELTDFALVTINY